MALKNPAWAEGNFAARVGETHNANPYSLRTDQMSHDAWLNGFAFAKGTTSSFYLRKQAQEKERLAQIITVAKCEASNCSDALYLEESMLNELHDIMVGDSDESEVTITIKFVKMTREEYENLPEFEG